MAEAAALAGVGWVVSPIVTRLLNEGFKILGCQAGGITDRLENLEIIHLEFQLMIEAAEKTNYKREIQRWLSKLKIALYKAEDTLDLYKYRLLEEKVNDLNSNPTAKFYSKFVGNVKKKLSNNFSPQKIMLSRSLNKLESIAKKANAIRQRLQIPIIRNDGPVNQNLTNGGQSDVTTSFLLHEVFGRKKELNEIINYLLLDPSEASKPEKRYSVGAIVGIVGVGKTTLAQAVYNNERVHEHFDFKMWVCVSPDLDPEKHTNDMIESFGKSAECTSLQGKHTELEKLVKLNKILLVLEDVYDVCCGNMYNETKWQRFLAPLASVKRGSKILVTTRKKDLPVALSSQYNMTLEKLQDNHIFSTLKFHALSGTELNDSNLQKQLEQIGKQIAQKLYGSPLAAKAVGCQLKNALNVDAWRAALGLDFCDYQRALLWSYQRLDASLQRCFSYLSLFPKGHKYVEEEIVHMWIAEGFIKSPNDGNGKRMEDIGRDYFKELVSVSFLQNDKYDTRYYMHDLFYELAQNVSKEDCLRIEGDQVTEIPPTIRYLSILGQHMRGNNMSLENLHTLMIKVDSLSSDAIDDIIAAVTKSKKLRVLMINCVSSERLTKDIADLKYLRLLSFNSSKDDALPVTFGQLYHLQVLDPPSRASLPRSLTNLINLRHFMGGEGALASLPDIGRLTSLQRLPEFVVKKENGHDIGQLKNLKEIRGSLTISNLENVEGKDKASEANLEVKEHLESLHLVWHSNDESEYKRDLDIEVLEGLQPHHHLTKLKIEGYRSSRYPGWLLSKKYLPNLRSLTLEKCTALEVLPPIGDLFPNCSELKISQLCKLREFPSLPQSLEKIVILDCPSLIFALDDDGRKKKSEPILPSSLKTLYLKNCNITDGALSQSLQGLTSLETLELVGIREITTLPYEQVKQHLTALIHLSIHSCPAISSLPEHLPKSLREIQLYSCPRISSLPEDLPQSLRKLDLFDSSNISSLPTHLPPSLMTIWIQGCPILEERCRSPNGEDWPKIAHIPYRDIHSGEAV